MLMRTDPFREFERRARSAAGASARGTWSRPAPLPMDAYRAGDEYVMVLDVPGVPVEAIELNVERNVLTVKAERRPTDVPEGVELQAAERPLGVFSRQLFLGDTLDLERIEAGYENGVLTVRVPVAAPAGPRRISVNGSTSEARQEHTDEAVVRVPSS
ncbi:Hsp20/alpha crystallin family protein [Kribbella sp. NPDC023855]|uniref:Hsp20/alpha crystallin family protein n=1 Tax=Kribbella sp. NPDC023855 TaxID=3154698 RepID=UPI0033F960D7